MNIITLLISYSFIMGWNSLLSDGSKVGDDVSQVAEKPYFTVEGVRLGDGRNYPEGMSYSGDVENGQANGRGTLVWPDGARYTGNFKDGVQSGLGVMESKDGTRYIGEFKDGEQTGLGTIIFPDGLKYSGEVRNGWPEGQGTLLSPNGAKYAGGYKAGSPDGQGVSIDGTSLFVGGYKNGLENGIGIKIYPDGSYDIGGWQNGVHSDMSQLSSKIREMASEMFERLNQAEMKENVEYGIHR